MVESCVRIQSHVTWVQLSALPLAEENCGRFVLSVAKGRDGSLSLCFCILVQSELHKWQWLLRSLIPSPEVGIQESEQGRQQFLSSGFRNRRRTDAIVPLEPFASPNIPTLAFPLYSRQHTLCFPQTCRALVA